MTAELRILGIDPSTSCTGWTMIDGDARVIRSGSIREPVAGPSAAARINAMVWRISELIPELKPTHVYAGAPWIRNSFGTGIQLIKLSGALGFGVHISSARKLSVVDIHDASARRIVGIKIGKIKGERPAHREARVKAIVFTAAVSQLKGTIFSSIDAAEAGIFALAGLMIERGEAVLKLSKPARKKGAKRLAAAKVPEIG